MNNGKFPSLSAAKRTSFGLDFNNNCNGTSAAPVAFCAKTCIAN